MKKLIAIVILTAFNACARQEGGEELILRVRTGNVPGAMLAQAMAETSRIVGQLGVVVRWKAPLEHSLDRDEVHRETHACSTTPVDVGVIDILILDRSQASDHPGALAYSLPFARAGFRIVVFYDRIAAASSPPSAKIFGHAMAHEVGHMLLGTLEHGAQGVMQAHWSGYQLSALESHPLQFTATEADVISRRIQRKRMACSATAAADE